jgi:hypothetical protein
MGLIMEDDDLWWVDDDEWDENVIYPVGQPFKSCDDDEIWWEDDDEYWA